MIEHPQTPGKESVHFAMLLPVTGINHSSLCAPINIFDAPLVTGKSQF